MAETDAEAVSDVDPDPAEDLLLAEALELLQEKLAETVELFAGASSSSCGEIAPKDEVVKEELDAEPVHDAPSMSAEGAKAATALEASKSKPVDPRLIKVKSEATEAVKGMALPQGQRSWQREEATEAAGSTDKVKSEATEAVKGMALPQGQRSWQREEATEAAGSTDKGKSEATEAAGSTDKVKSEAVKSEATEAVKVESEATEAAGSTDKGKGQGKEKRQRKERGGKWGGWNTVKRYLEGVTSREPLRQFLRDYPQGHDAAGPTPSSGYPELNDQHTRTNTINWYKRQDW